MGLCLAGVVAPFSFEGGMNGDKFESYIRERVVPELREGDIVLVDNLGAHRKLGIRELIEARGAEYKYLPAYSPELNPVEECGSKIKESVRSDAPRTAQAVHDAIARGVGRVTAKDAAGWFDHAAHDRAPRPHPPAPGCARTKYDRRPL